MANILNADIRTYYLSEHALTVRFADEISEKALQQVQALNNLLLQQPFAGLTTTVPAYTSLSVFYDPFIVLNNETLTGEHSFDKVSGYIHQLTTENVANVSPAGDLVSIPVCYGGTFGPDLKEVAALNHISTQQVIHLHQNADYLVGMIGFLPGFTYLIGLNEVIATPRRSSPRKKVPAGSVGIAGTQTGIYPLDSPGGWQIIGRTPLTLFDVSRQPPALLKTGDKVAFKPISAEEFEDIAHARYADNYR